MKTYLCLHHVVQDGLGLLRNYYPDMIKNLSTCKSPQQMMGSIIKTYYAEKNNIDPKKVFM